MNIINLTGKTIALNINDKFVTFPCAGKKASLILHNIDKTIGGITFRQCEIKSIENLQDTESSDIVIVSEEVAKYLWSLGKYNYCYLGHGFIKDDTGNSLVSYQLVCYNINLMGDIYKKA
jgi:hypothetical protein